MPRRCLGPDDTAVHVGTALTVQNAGPALKRCTDCMNIPEEYDNFFRQCSDAGFSTGAKSKSDAHTLGIPVGAIAAVGAVAALF